MEGAIKGAHLGYPYISYIFPIKWDAKELLRVSQPSNSCAMEFSNVLTSTGFLSSSHAFETGHSGVSSLTTAAETSFPTSNGLSAAQRGCASLAGIFMDIHGIFMRNTGKYVHTQ